MNPDHLNWLKSLNKDIPIFLDKLKVPGQPGRFLPCLNGLTEPGRKVALGFSCFVLKTYYTLGLWGKLSKTQQKEWIGYIGSFQKDLEPRINKGIRNAFVDPVLVDYFDLHLSLHRRLVDIFFPQKKSVVQQVVIAETKQAIATLAQVGEKPKKECQGFPTLPIEVENYLNSMDWAKPWSAGGQAAALVVFLKTQGQKTQESLKVCEYFFQNLADAKTGAYFKGKEPVHSELINGAMKILSALDWFDIPIHYPNQLIDSVLASKPAPEGCHLVDAVYVLYRCAKQSKYKQREIKNYLTKVIDMIRAHQNSEGGFSYYIKQSQTNYYGVPISQGLNESDIHGTCLLTWALAMILDILGNEDLNWKLIKP